jgi:hypothetical protein
MLIDIFSGGNSCAGAAVFAGLSGKVYSIAMEERA